MFATIMMAAVMAFSTQAADVAIVEQIAAEYDLPVAYIEEYNPEIVENRTDDALLVEITESVSDGGGYGHDSWGLVYYNRDVPKGERVTSYIVYNPYTQYGDDVVAVVDNGMKR